VQAEARRAVARAPVPGAVLSPVSGRRARARGPGTGGDDLLQRGAIRGLRRDRRSRLWVLPAHPGRARRGATRRDAAGRDGTGGVTKTLTQPGPSARLAPGRPTLYEARHTR